MKRRYFIVLNLFLYMASFNFAQDVHSIFLEEAKKVIRLKPSSFPELPDKIKDYLTNNSYTIPQIFDSEKPHNVIIGEFIAKGVKDWAVLASKNLKSKILVFHNGNTDKKNVIELAESEDIGYLQGIDEKRIGFSRYISTVDKDFIDIHYEWYGGTKPPSIDHNGIDDSFVEKASVVLYFYKGKWLRLTGAD